MESAEGGAAFVFVLLTIPFVRSEEYCGEFVLPTQNGSAVTVKENTTITFPVHIKTTRDCLDTARVMLFTKQCTRQHKTEDRVPCNVAYHNGKCTSWPDSACTCPDPEDGRTAGFVFSRTVGRTDCAVRFFSDNVQIIKSATVSLNVLYPPRVISVTVGSEGRLTTEVVEENSTVEVTCTWDPGNPATHPFLLHLHRMYTISVDYHYREFRYRLERVSCQDAGHIHCVAPGATENRTATLLVRCIPEISILQAEKTTDGAVHLTLAVRSHTSNFSECTLHTVQNVTREYPCDALSVTGNPPNVTVHVMVKSVTTRDRGTWRLTLANDVGTGHLEFTPVLMQAASSDCMPVPNNIVIAGSVVIIIGLLVASIIVIYVKRGSRNCKPPAVRPEGSGNGRPERPVDERAARPGSENSEDRDRQYNPYEEIQIP